MNSSPFRGFRCTQKEYEELAEHANALKQCCTQRGMHTPDIVKAGLLLTAAHLSFSDPGTSKDLTIQEFINSWPDADRQAMKGYAEEVCEDSPKRLALLLYMLLDKTLDIWTCGQIDN